MKKTKKEQTEERKSKFTKDMRECAKTMDRDQARYLVDLYYQMQDNRMRAAGQCRAMGDEPHDVIEWAKDNALAQEEEIKKALKYYAEGDHMGRWAMSVKGIGPIMAAGLLAHIKMRRWKCFEEDKCTPDNPHGPDCHEVRTETAGQVWRYAGMDPTSKWNKGEKRPWNASLKRLCFLIGESFVKTNGRYRELYDQRKAYEIENNMLGKYAEVAAQVLSRTPNHAQRAKYKEGILPDGHIHMRAKRWAVKLFLAHWHAEAYRHEFNAEPPLPYPIAQLGHAHIILPG